MELVHDIPRDGIVIALTGTLPPHFRAPQGMFLAGVIADGLPHPSAHCHIAQNAAHAHRLPRGIFMPHWTQPGLLMRDPVRGNTFERVAFYGTKSNLAPELQTPEWAEHLLHTVGCTFDIRSAEHWHDYHDVDVVLAVRTFGRQRQLHKPATKLYNAWRAGIPFIGGRNSAFAADGNPGRDYLIARSPDEIIRHLQKLKSDENFYCSLVEQGLRKAADYSDESITARWRKLVEETLPTLATQRFARPLWRNFCSDASMRIALAVDRTFRS